MYPMILFEVDINLLYLFLLQRYIIIFIDQDKKCKCKNYTYKLPIPIKKDKNKLTIDGYCCSFQCLLEYLDKVKYQGDLKYNYSLNIIWSILPFMISQTDFV